MEPSRTCKICGFYLWAPLSDCGFAWEVWLSYVNPSSPDEEWVNLKTGITGAAHLGKYIWIGDYPEIEVGAEVAVYVHSVGGEDINGISFVPSAKHNGIDILIYQPKTATWSDFVGAKVSGALFDESMTLDGVNVVAGP